MVKYIETYSTRHIAISNSSSNKKKFSRAVFFKVMILLRVQLTRPLNFRLFKLFILLNNNIKNVM